MSQVNVSELVAIHQFLHEIEGLKTLLRHSWLSDGRRESVAEHTWRMAMMVIVLAPHLEKRVDVGRVIKMVLVHDLAEVVVGDYHAWKDVPTDKHEQEKRGLQQLLQSLPESTAKEITTLWLEFEDNKTLEARFGQALDKLEVILQHNEADISTWEDKEYDFNYYYAYDKVKFSKVLTVFRDLMLEETVSKIELEAGV